MRRTHYSPRAEEAYFHRVPWKFPALNTGHAVRNHVHDAAIQSPLRHRRAHTTMNSIHVTDRGARAVVVPLDR